MDCSILKCDQGIEGVLQLIINIMTAGIAILATIGIVVSGVQYLTAGGNEEQVKKSKRRLFEIIIGLVAYAIVASILSWLLPGFKQNNGGGSSSGGGGSSVQTPPSSEERPQQYEQ